MSLAMRKCVQKHSTLLKRDLVKYEIQPLVCRKKLILICKLGCVQDIMHFIIQLALLDYSFPLLILACFIRLAYCTSNFQIATIAHTSLPSAALVKQQACMWLANKKRIKVLGINNSFLY